MDLRNEYFEWLFNLSFNSDTRYKRLAGYLMDIDYYYILEMDANRYERGISLRYRFGYENEIPQQVIATELDNKPCSVLEMMTSLALSIEEEIMSNLEENDTHRWFFMMIKNLGLDNLYYAKDEVEKIVDIWLSREHQPNGYGTPFPTRRQVDMRTIETWKQMIWYVTDNLT